MRLLIFCFIGLMLWAGTISIRYGEHTPKPPRAQAQTCVKKIDEGVILDFLTNGLIVGIQDTGSMFTFSLPANWSGLPPSTQRHTYETLACYAQAQNHTFQILLTGE